MSEFSKAIALTVPTADTVDNVDVLDVVGNKTDTANVTVGATSSIMRYIKGIISILAGLCVIQKSEVTIFDPTTTGNVYDASSGGVANTFGAYLEMEDSAAADCVIDSFMLKNDTVTGSVDTRVIAEIALGAAGSEVPLLTIACMPNSEIAEKAAFMYYPQARCFIPSGSRVAVRVMDTHAGPLAYHTTLTLAK